MSFFNANSLTTATNMGLQGFKLGAMTAQPHLAGIAAAVGFVGGLFMGQPSGGGGSGKGIGKKTMESIRSENKTILENLQRDAAKAIQATEIAVKQYNDLRDYKYSQEMENFLLAVEQRESNYKQAVRLHRDSVRAFDETVDLNNISATMAMNDARRVYNDRRADLNNQAQLLQMGLAAGRRNRSLNEKLISKQLNSSIKDAKYNALGINKKLRYARNDGKNAMREATRQFEFATLSAQNDIDIKELQLQGQDNLLKGEMATLEGEKNALVASANLKKDEVLNNIDNAKAEANFAQQTLALQKDERYAEAAIQTDQLRRQGLLEQSAQIAKGQAGRSAAKSVQGMAFSNQQAQKLIAASITRADAKHVIDKTKIAQSLYNTQKQGKYELRSTQIGLAKAKKEFGAAKYKMAARKSEMGILKKESKQVEDKLKFDKQTAKKTIRETRGTFDQAKSLAKVDLAKLSNEINLTQAQFQDQFIKNDLQQYNLAAQTKLSLKSMKRAGNTLRTQLQLSKERILFDKMLSNRAAKSQVLDPPKVPALIPPPIYGPDMVVPPEPDIDWDGIERQMNKNRKAKRTWNPGSDSTFNVFRSNIQSIAEQAASLAQSFKGPPQVQTPQQMVDLDYQQVSNFVSDTFNNDLAGIGQNIDFQVPDIATPTLDLSQFGSYELDNMTYSL